MHAEIEITVTLHDTLDRATDRKTAVRRATIYADNPKFMRSELVEKVWPLAESIVRNMTDEFHRTANIEAGRDPEK
jgi:hypothetical protein